jgi:hypothetical protein
LKYPKDDTSLDPLQILLEIKTWGIKWKKLIDKTNEWLAWQWANAKIDKELFSLLKHTVHISKEDMEDYNLAMFTHAMDFFKERMSLKKPILEHFFTSLLNNLLREDLVTLGNLFSIKFMKPQRQLYATPG